MKNYDGPAVDSYMRRVLQQDLSDTEADNALTLLSTLTLVAEDYFPHERTFVRVNRARLKFHPEMSRVRGITLSTAIEDGEERSIYIPRAHLKCLKTSMNSLFGVLGDHHSLDKL